jgi:hypothetical protein
MMAAWIPPAPPTAILPRTPQPQRPQPQPRLKPRATDEPKPSSSIPTIAPVQPAPEPPPAFDAAAFVPPPPAIAPPAEQNVSLLFVGIEDGEWLRWLEERHGFVAFTTRRDTVIEQVYSVTGELMPLSAVPLAEAWSLEVDQPERVAALATLLTRERQHAPDGGGRIRAFALFPASFRNEVAAAVHHAGVTGGSVFISFEAGELKVVSASLSESKK